MRTPQLSDREIAHLIWIGNLESGKANAPGFWLNNGVIVGLARHKLVTIRRAGFGRSYRLTDLGRNKYASLEVA